MLIEVLEMDAGAVGRYLILADARELLYLHAFS